MGDADQAEGQQVGLLVGLLLHKQLLGFGVLPESGVGIHLLRIPKGVAIYLEIRDEKVIEKRKSKQKSGVAASKKASINVDSIG